MFQGSMVALVSPMTKTGEVDKNTLRNLIEPHIAAGTNAILINGTTGEAPTLTEEDRAIIIKTTIEAVRGRIPVVAGTGTYGTADTIRLTQQAKDLGVDAALILTPSCNKPTQEGLYQHYSAVAKAVALPIIMYNEPGRTCCDMLPETVARLSEISNIIGIKEGNDLARGRALLEACGDNMSLYSSVDASALMFMLQGGKGVFSVTANIAPRAMRAMCDAALSGNARLAGEINAKLMPLHKGLFVETNPIPIKWAMRHLGLIAEGIRLPLTPLSEQYHDVIKEAIKISEEVENV